ncbi:MAG: hypothetical protein KF746_09060 [Chitinophagaceae bacterium]|nr:hypothetical protein [Chitinophagaceae bacterium]
MRKLIFVFLIALIAEDVSSQGDHFIYIQADNQQSFYVRSGSKMFRSSGEGYLVIPGLLSNNYELIIGFPGVTPVTEWRFDCTIDEKDLGFILKRSTATGAPELINLGQKDGITGTKVRVKEEKKTMPETKPLTGSISDDPFSKMLADVVNDPSIRLQPVIIEKKTEPVLAAAPTTVVDSTSKSVAIVQKKDSAGSLAGLTTGAKNTPAAAKDSIQATPGGENKTVALKETSPKTDSALTKATVVKPDPTRLANTVAAKQPDNLPFVVKEIKKEEKEAFVLKETPATRNKPTTSDNSTDQKTLPFTVQPREEPVATVKKQDVPNDKTSPGSDNSGKATATVTAQPKEESFVAKELPKTDNKASTANSNPGDKKTLPFTVQPKEEPVAVKESPKTENAIQPNAVNGADKNNGTSTPPKEDKPFVLKETITAKKERADKIPTVSEPAKNVVTSSVSIKKTLQRKSIDGIELIYVDEGENGAKDTIRILIPGVK